MVTFSFPLSAKVSQMFVPLGTLEPSGPEDIPPHGVPESNPLPVGNGGGSLNFCLGGGVGAAEEGALPFSAFFTFGCSGSSTREECIGTAMIRPLDVGASVVKGGAG